MIRMMTSAMSVLVAWALLGAPNATAALPIDACTPPSVYPYGPSVYATDAVTFPAYAKNTDDFVVQFWREPCTGPQARSLLFARFACGTHGNGFAMLQSGVTGTV